MPIPQPSALHARLAPRLLQRRRLDLRRSRIESDRSISSFASSGVIVPTVTMSQSRIVFQTKLNAWNGRICPAAIGLIVITGFLAPLMMRDIQSHLDLHQEAHRVVDRDVGLHVQAGLVGVDDRFRACACSGRVLMPRSRIALQSCGIWRISRVQLSTIGSVVHWCGSTKCAPYFTSVSRTLLDLAESKPFTASRGSRGTAASRRRSP